MLCSCYEIIRFMITTLPTLTFHSFLECAFIYKKPPVGVSNLDYHIVCGSHMHRNWRSTSKLKHVTLTKGVEKICMLWVIDTVFVVLCFVRLLDKKWRVKVRATHEIEGIFDVCSYPGR